MWRGKRLKYLRISFLFYILTSFITPLLGARGPGSTGAIILTQTTGARCLGMGDSFVALADDVNGISFNPAGIAFLKTPEVSLTYLDGLLDSWYGFIGYAQPLGGSIEKNPSGGRLKFRKGRSNRATIALGFSIFQAGKMVLDPEGNTVVAEQDYVGNLDFGYVIWRGQVRKMGRAVPRFHNEISLGIGVKLIHSTLVENYSAIAYACDVGALGSFLVGRGRLRMGIAGQNLGTKIKFAREGDPLPLTIRAGSSLEICFKEEHRLTIGLEVVKKNDAELRENTGIEYCYKEVFALRVGYRIGYDTDNLTCGVGLGWRNLQLDYGWGMGTTRMGDNHRVSLTMRF